MEATKRYTYSVATNSVSDYLIGDFRDEAIHSHVILPHSCQTRAVVSITEVTFGLPQ